MEESSSVALSLQSIEDEREGHQSNRELACDTVSEDCAFGIKMGDSSELPSSPIDPQQIGKDEPLSSKDLKSKAVGLQSDLPGLMEEASLYGSKNEYLDREMFQQQSEFFTYLLEQEHKAANEFHVKEPANELQSLSICKGPEREESAAVDHVISTTPSNIVTALNQELRVKDETAFVNRESEKTGPVYSEERHDGFEEVSGCLDEPCSSTKGTSQTSLFHPVNESGQQQTLSDKESVGDPEILPPFTGSRKDEVHVGLQDERDSFLDPSNQEWSDLDFGEATLSTGIEGWQHFDSEEVNISTDYTPQGTNQGGGTWEQLLDDGLDSIQKDNVVQSSQLVLPIPYRESDFELPSPGNPFMEELGRASFSDRFTGGNGVPSTDRLAGVSQWLPPSGWKEGLLDGVPTDHSVAAEYNRNDVQPNPVNVQDNKMRLKSSTSLDFLEPFEAPSFMSLVDPKSHALLEACMPTYRANRPMHGHENDGGNWEANFDLVAPSTQEITRSISLPRPGSDSLGQRPGQSVSFTVNREQETSRKESQSPSTQRAVKGFLSPKFSPLVQKVVDKVRGTPAVATGMLNTVRQAMSPKASEKKSSSGSLLTRCMCW